jgi:hypothetical protein
MPSALATWYFRPRDFESGALYPILGVRIYKRFVPTSGEWISRLRGIDRLEITAAGNLRVALQNYELQTRTWEWRHLASAALLQAWAFIGGVAVGVEQFWGCSAINLLVNAYPIMVQRFNRARIALILRREPRPLSSATRIGILSSADVTRTEPRHLRRIEADERSSERGAPSQDRDPAQPRLEPIEHELLVQRAITRHGHAPLAVVVGHVHGIAAAPPASIGRSVVRVRSGHAWTICPDPISRASLP